MSTPLYPLCLKPALTLISMASVILGLLLSGIALAHESPEHHVQHLTTHLKNDRNAKNLHQRAIAYRALNQLEKAHADLIEAIKLEPKHLDSHLELTRILLAQQKPAKALLSANDALKLCHSPAQKARVHILRAECYHLSNQAKPALQACQLAFREVPKGEIEWFLLRSECQLKLGHHKQRIAGLITGFKTHHSAVLKAHWIDALIDASQFQTALSEINKELTHRRWQSNWLIKRARTLQGLDRTTEATADLHTALAEIHTRLTPERPDPLLLADQGIAHALLGNPTKAKQCLKTLRQHRVSPWVTSQLEVIIHQLENPTTK